MKVYCYRRCTTCRKALKWLNDNGIDYELIDIKADHPDEKTLREYYAVSGLPLKRFFNTSGIPYREMGLSQKLPEMSEDEQIALLATDGMLVRRPLLVDDGFVLAGFNEDEWAEKLISGKSQAADAASKIGIIGAMNNEVASLKSEMINSVTMTVAGMDFCEGTLDGKPVVVVQSGFGKVNAGICAQLLINMFQVDSIINTGVAGSLNAEIDIGDFVISTDAVQHDFDATPIGFARGEIPYTGLCAFPADEAMRAKAVRAVRASAPDVKVFEGRICSGDQFISSHAQKEAILEAFEGFCCEMEGAAIAQVCYLNNKPFVIIRAISDKADDSEEMSYFEFVQAAAARSAAVTRYMLSH